MRQSNANRALERMGVTWLRALLVLLCLIEEGRSRDPEETQLLLQELLTKMEEISNGVGLYQADLHHKIGGGLAERRLGGIQEAIRGVNLFGVPISSDVVADLRATLGRILGDVEDVESHDAIQSELADIREDIDEDLDTTVVEQIRRLLMRHIEKLSDRAKDEAERLLPREVIEHLVSEELEDAVEKTKVIGPNVHKLRFIVRNVYRQSESGFDILMKYKEKIQDEEMSDLITVLILEESEHNIRRLVLLTRAIISLKNHQDLRFSKILEFLLRRAMEAVEEESVKELKKDLKKGEDAGELLGSIAGLEAYPRIIRRVTKEVFSEVPTIKLLDLVSGLSDVDQVLEGTAVVWEHMKHMGDLSASLKVALVLKEHLGSGWDEKELERMDVWRAELGESIEVAAFGGKVCLWNLDRGGFLNGTSLGEETEWEVSWEGNGVKLLGEGGALCASTDREGLWNRTRTVQEGGEDCEEDWWVEPTSEGACLIRDVGLNEYLFAGDEGELSTDMDVGSNWTIQLCDKQEVYREMLTATKYFQTFMEGVRERRENNQTNDIEEMITRLRNFTRSVRHHSYFRRTLHTFQDATRLMIRNAFADLLSETSRRLINNPEEANATMQNIHILGSGFYEEVAKRTARVLYGKTPTEGILNLLMTHPDLEGKIHGLLGVVRERQRVNNQSEQMLIGFYVKKIVDSVGFDRVPFEERQQIAYERQMLGKSMENAVFGGSICVWNLAKEGFLSGRVLGEETEWGVVWTGEGVRLLKGGDGEALCAAKGGERGKGGEGCEWEVEKLDDVDCLIRNKATKGYLFAGEGGEIGTGGERKRVKGKEWRIQPCQNLAMVRDKTKKKE